MALAAAALPAALGASPMQTQMEMQTEMQMVRTVSSGVGSTDSSGHAALMAAAQQGRVQAVRELLRTRVDVNQVDGQGQTALLQAVVRGDGGPAYVEIVRLLLARGANPEQADASGVSPLTHAERRGQVLVAALLRAASMADKPSTLER